MKPAAIAEVDRQGLSKGATMRNGIGIVFAALLLGAGAAGAAAMPADTGLAGLRRPDMVPIQFVCDPRRCIDPRTGAYTQSGCNRRGCYPISGIVGYERPNRVMREYGQPQPYYGRPEPYYGRAAPYSDEYDEDARPYRRRYHRHEE